MKKVLSFLLISILICFTSTTSTNTEALTNDLVVANDLNAISKLSIDLESHSQIGSFNIVKIKVNNKNINTNFSFGWVNSCELVLLTSNGETIKHQVNSGKIYHGEKTYSYNLTFEGEIDHLYFTDIRLLDDRGLPAYDKNNGDIKYDCVVSLNGVRPTDLTPFIIGGVIVLVLLFLIVVNPFKFGSTQSYKRLGSLLMFIGIIMFLYGAYNFATKPTLGQSDFQSTSMTYWLCCGLGIVLCGCGGYVRKYKKGPKHYKNTGVNEHQQFINDEIRRQMMAQNPNANSYNSNYRNMHGSNNYNTSKGKKNKKNNNFDDMTQRMIQEEVQRQIREQNMLINNNTFQEQNRLFEQNVQETNRRNQEQQNQQMQEQFQQQFNDFNNHNNNNNNMF